MHYNYVNVATYTIWVDAKPTYNGRHKQAYYDAVIREGKAVIADPIASNDIFVEIVYATSTPVGQRMDTDNVNKPTLDALKGVAYLDDRQVRDVRASMFDRDGVEPISVSPRDIQRFLAANDVVRISIYSDSRLIETNGPAKVEELRARFGNKSGTLTEPDEFVPSAGVYREIATGYYVCPRCRADDKRSLLVNGSNGFSCPVCTGYFRDTARPAHGFLEAPRRKGGPNDWMG